MTKQYIETHVDTIGLSELSPIGMEEFSAKDLVERAKDVQMFLNTNYGQDAILRLKYYTCDTPDISVYERRLETDEEFQARLAKEQKVLDNATKAKQKKIDNLLKTMSKEEILELLA
jgi:hypothetical protein